MKFKISTFLVIASFFFLLINSNVQAKGRNTLVKKNIIEVKEQSLEIEDWMIDNNVWDVHTKENAFMLDVEKDLELDNWMINHYSWKNNQTIDIQQEKDDALEIEPRMINFPI